MGIDDQFDVFISHASEDKARFVEPLLALRERGDRRPRQHRWNRPGKVLEHLGYVRELYEKKTPEGMVARAQEGPVRPGRES